MNEEYEIERSPLCQDITDMGKKVRVEIYRGGGSDWLLEVVDEFGNSTVWDDQFSTDAEALEEVRATIKIEGIFEAKPGSIEGDELDILGILVDDYEKSNFRIDPPDVLIGDVVPVPYEAHQWGRDLGFKT